LGDIIHMKSSNNHTPTQSRSLKIPRPLLPQFLTRKPIEAQEQPDQGLDINTSYREYEMIDEDIHEKFSYRDLCDLKHKYSLKEGNKGAQIPQNFDLMCKVGRLTIPPFDGSTKRMTKAWVHKLDTYLQLNPMTEAEEIKYATLHLEGEAHEWWYHGLVTLGHTNITSYVDFTQSLMDKFDKKDPEIHFRELAQLRQTGTPEAYITYFHRMAVMVTDISQQILVMLFMEGLVEPLRGWVKAFRPTTLHEAIMRSQDMKDAVNKKVPTKSFIPQGGKETKFPQKSWTGKDRMDEETWRELRRK
jgi:hypothetical protein